MYATRIEPIMRLTCICLVLVYNFSFAQQTLNRSSDTNYSMENAIKIIQATGAQKDLHRLQTVGDSLIREMDHEDPHRAQLYLEMANQLSSWDFQPEQEKLQLLKKYASEGLEVKKAELETEFQLLNHHQYVSRQLGWSNDENFAAQRKSITLKWLNAWSKLETDLDPNFNHDAVPMLNIAPPVASGMPAGVDPKAIEDPKLRAEYEKAIEENAQHIAYYARQINVRKEARNYRSSLLTYFQTNYSEEQLSEVRKMVESMLHETTLKMEIYAAIEKN